MVKQELDVTPIKRTGNDTAADKVKASQTSTSYQEWVKRGISDRLPRPTAT